MGVNDARDNVIVDMSSKASQVLDTGDALLFCLMCQHGPVDTVTDGIDGWNGCLEVVVDLLGVAVPYINDMGLVMHEKMTSIIYQGI